MRAVAALATLVAIGALAMLAWRGWGARKETSALRSADTSEEVADLRREVAVLRAELRRQHAMPVALPPAATPDAGSPRASIRHMTDEERAADDRARADEMAAAVAASFQGEGTDPAWSAPMAARIQAEMKAAGMTEALRAVDCARTMCRVALQLEDEDLRDHLADRLSDLSSFQSQVFYQHHFGASPPRVTLFVARTGHQLPLATR